MKNVIARKLITQNKDEPTHINADSSEKGDSHLANIHKMYLLQLLKRRISNSIQYTKEINANDEYKDISKLRLSPQLRKRRSHSHIFQDSPKWQHNIIIRKCDYPNSKLEVVFRKGSICKGRPIIASQLCQRKGSEINGMNPNRALNRLINHKSTFSFDETVKNSDKSRNDEYEYKTNITDSIKFKHKLPKLMPRKKYNIIRIKQRSLLNESGLPSLNKGWDLGRENIEFSNETLAIQ